MRGAVNWFLPYLDGKPWTASGAFTPSKLSDPLWILASATGNKELCIRVSRIGQDPAARRNLLFPMDRTNE